MKLLRQLASSCPAAAAAKHLCHRLQQRVDHDDDNQSRLASPASGCQCTNKAVTIKTKCLLHTVCHVVPVSVLDVNVYSKQSRHNYDI